MQNHSQSKSGKEPWRSLRIPSRNTIRPTLKQIQQRQRATTLPAKWLNSLSQQWWTMGHYLFQSLRNQNKCDVCNNFDPRGHDATQAVSINGIQTHTLLLGPGFPGKYCGYCNLLVRVVMKFYPFSNDLKYDRIWKPKVLAILLAENYPVSLWVPVHHGEDIHHCGWLDIYALSDIPVMPSIGKASRISKNSDSPSCFDFIQKCLSDCHNHVGCKTCYSSTLPRRLLYLDGPSNSFSLKSDQSPKIRLFETNGQSYRYATLSHCWGSTQIIATKRANITTFEEAIHWHLLPKTFQDAIITALRLKVYYIWIDSLCIIQDDEIDWDTEAAIMGAIYENSYLTIAATSSPSGAVPFLGQRSARYGPQTLHFPNPKRLSSTINNDTVHGNSDDIKSLRVRQGPSTRSINLSQLFNPRIYGPLTTRGWALQERVLSSRIVHFTEEGIVWECRTSIQSEDQRRLFPGHPQKWNSFSDITDKAIRRSKLQSFWRELLMDYTKRRLTERKDILPALSGIAARMHNFHQSRYLAGLWYDRFIEDLCWRPLSIGAEYEPFIPSPSDSVPYEDIDLPSWSWISIRQSISFAVADEPGTFTTYSKVVGCQCIPADKSPFGRVRSGCAIVEGPLFEASISYDGVQATFTNPRISEIIIELQGPLLAYPQARMNNGRLVNTVRRAYKGEEIKSLKSTVWCLYLGRWKPKKFGYTVGSCHVHDFLLILGLSTKTRGSYERIGNIYSICEELTVKLFKEAPVMRVSIV